MQLRKYFRTLFNTSKLSQATPQHEQINMLIIKQIRTILSSKQEMKKSCYLLFVKTNGGKYLDRFHNSNNDFKSQMGHIKVVFHHNLEKSFYSLSLIISSMVRQIFLIVT